MTNKTAPNARKYALLMPSPIRNTRCRNSAGSITTGCPRAACSFSHRTVVVTARPPTAMSSHPHQGQWLSGARVTAAKISSRPADRPPSPAGSTPGRAALARDGSAGTIRPMSQAPGRATGRTTRNIARQDNPQGALSTRKPPSTCPRTAPSPRVTPNQAVARPRSVGREQAGDQREDLGDHDSGASTLDDACRHQFRAGLAQRAQAGCNGEADHPRPEQRPVPEDVPEPPAGYEQGAVSQGVTADGQLQQSGGGVQAGLHAGRCDVDDEQVELSQEAAQQDRRKWPPVPARGGWPAERFVV